MGARNAVLSIGAEEGMCRMEFRWVTSDMSIMKYIGVQTGCGDRFGYSTSSGRLDPHLHSRSSGEMQCS